jgi:RHH-type transcriptional regulator, proline utilization regulon repressor / proline dehydrogenase / delta 1-pyrroline-5-carboxylate dehydrogenase
MSSQLPGKDAIAQDLFTLENELVPRLVKVSQFSATEEAAISAVAQKLVVAVRAGRRKFGMVDAFMNEYQLSSEEGVVLMCLAEALLRIPDAQTADKLIADKIGSGHWDEHVGQSSSLFVNASTWGLMLTGRVVEMEGEAGGDVWGYVKKLVHRSGEPVIRQAMRHAMRIMGRQFVLGRTIKEALQVAAQSEAAGYCHSYDMLGEAAITHGDAQRYFDSYKSALEGISQSVGDKNLSIFRKPSLSVKLSALHPRFEPAKEQRLLKELLPKLVDLCQMARTAGIGLTIDAEEAERLDISLELFGRLAEMPELAGWDGLGLAVQAYGRRALPVLKWLKQLGDQTQRRFPLRLVKGAYWDSEVKWAQVSGLDSYPVFTRKSSTDVSYLACARYMIACKDRFYCQFATHNAHTVAAIMVMMQDYRDFEFQRLHGMGEALYNEVVGDDNLGIACRIYAPVGSHEDLLAYLVRRLLENGANTSFVNRLADDAAPMAEIIRNPIERVNSLTSYPHPKIPAPVDLLMPVRQNSAGLALWEASVRLPLVAEIEKALQLPTSAGPLVAEEKPTGQGRVICSPHNTHIEVGHVIEADVAMVSRAVESGAQAQPAWNKAGGEARAQILEIAADLFEQNTARLMALLIREAGKTLDNALGDIREAVDFLRYYAYLARKDFGSPQALTGPTGELNEIRLAGRGVFACISPWNFPLAIFTGQVSAALAAGNSAVAKPAEQTPLVAFEAVKLMHQAGVPEDVLSLLPGRGDVVGAALINHPLISGVAFTGSNQTARAIQISLANREGAILPLIAETGGINAMIIDSSALTEQVVGDVVRSAFDSAGQRCSAARVMFVQEDVADRTFTMLKGAMEELSIGDPFTYATDIGPVIDGEAKKRLNDHKLHMSRTQKCLIDLPLPPETENGFYVSPAAYQIDNLSVLKHEVFGPVLHLIRYKADQLDKVCEAINSSGFGLTLGLHTRVNSTVDYIQARVKVGNLYVNRDQIGAVVGVQPFGGEGLSGTGPKAGGPQYLHRFAVERVVSTNITASGGNAHLMTLETGD